MREGRHLTPTLNIFCGSTTGGLDLLRAFLRVACAEGQALPIVNLGVDTDLGRIAEVEAAVRDEFPGAETWFFCLGKGMDLRGMAERPDRHPQVAETLRGIDGSLIPRSIDRGSQKVFAFTLAAFQASWAAPGGILEVLQDAVRTLQKWQARFGGRGKYTVNITGLGCGGVGGIAPLLLGAAVRAIGGTNPDFGRNLELNLIWVEPWPEERDPRVIGNARESLVLVEAAQEGRLRIPVPNANGIDHLGGSPVFDNVFIASEVTSHGRLDTQSFVEALAHILFVWCFDPLGDEARSRLADKLSIREERVEGHRRFFGSVGLKGLRLEVDPDYVSCLCIRGLEALLEGGEDGRSGEAAERYITAQGLLPRQLGAVLSQDPFGHPHLRYGDFREWIREGAEERLRGDTNIGAWLIEEVLHKARLQVERDVAAARERKLEEARDSLEAALRPYLEALEVSKAIVFLEGLAGKLGELVEKVQHPLPQTDDRELRRAIARLERIRGSWIGRATRARGVISALAQAATQYLKRQVEGVVLREVLRFYEELGRLVNLRVNKLVRFRQAFAEAIARAKAKLGERPPYKAGSSEPRAVEPFLEEGEFLELVREELGYRPETPGRELAFALARELEPLERWAEDSEGLHLQLKKFFIRRLEGLVSLDVPSYVRRKARRTGRSEREIWEEVRGRLRLKGTLWAVDHTELPTSRPPSIIRILALPEQDVAVDLEGTDVKIVGDPGEVALLGMEVGVHKEALAAWKRYRSVPEPMDGKGPIRPPGLVIDHG